MKILIIGVNGFIGSHSFSYFKSKGHKVYGCATRGIPSKRLFIVDKFNADFDSIFKEHKFDVCVNAAGSSGVSFSIQEPEKDYQLNVGIIRKVLIAIREHSPKTKLVHLSSAAVYGNPKSLPIKESAPTNPISPYGHHKLQSEEICAEFYKEYAIPTISLRIFSVYGPGLRKQLFWDIYQKSIQSSKLDLFGTGKETRDYIFIEDLLNAISLIIEKSEFKNEVINVANGIEVTIKKAADILIKELGSGNKINFNGENRKGDPLNWRADIGKLKGLGYKPTRDIESGLSKLAKWIGKI